MENLTCWHNGKFKKIKEDLIFIKKNVIQTLCYKPHAKRNYPAPDNLFVSMSELDKKLSGSLMRVNHVGEVCAQALYVGQILTARDPYLRDDLIRASKEEWDHLAWTFQRLEELDSKPSILNPIWYTGAFFMGFSAGILSDKISLSFLAETEFQVEKHLIDHIGRIPKEDRISFLILDKMKEDELKHALYAIQAGGKDLPSFIKVSMMVASDFMKKVAYKI